MKPLTVQDDKDFPTGANANGLTNFKSRNVLKNVPRLRVCLCGTYMHVSPEPEQGNMKRVWQLEWLELFSPWGHQQA